jgi:hypothetical protein
MGRERTFAATALTALALASTALATTLLTGCAVGLPHARSQDTCTADSSDCEGVKCGSVAWVQQPDRYLLADYKLHYEPSPAPPPAVQETEAARNGRSGWMVATVRGSRVCEGGFGHGPGCGMWISAMEDALLARGFVVVAYPDYEATRAESPRAASAPPAKGAPKEMRRSVQIIVDLREAAFRPTFGIRGDEQWSFFESDGNGGRGAPYSPTDGERESLRRLLEPRAGHRGEATHRGIEARLSVSVVAADTGETIWTYGGREVARGEHDEHVRFLLGERGGVFWPISPAGKGHGRHGPGAGAHGHAHGRQHGLAPAGNAGSGAKAAGRPMAGPHHGTSGHGLCGHDSADMMTAMAKRLSDDAVQRLRGQSPSSPPSRTGGPE